MNAHVKAQISQVRALDLQERTSRVIWTALERLAETASIPTRAAFALYEVFNGRELTAPYYANVAAVSRATTTNDLRQLAAAGLIGPVGETRSRRYVAGGRLFQAIGAELNLTTPSPDRSAIVAQVVGRTAATVGPPRRARRVPHAPGSSHARASEYDRRVRSRPKANSSR